MINKLICPVCRSSNITKFWAMPKYQLARCLNCTLVWDNSIKREITKVYEKPYFSNNEAKGGYTNYFEGMKVNRKTFSDRLKKIESKLGKKGKLLDVGCALGECLLEAKLLGWKNAQGVELSKFAYNFAKKRGLNVKRGVLNNTFKPNYFDVVSYQDVIEHIPNTIGELKKANRVLKPGGIIFLVTPNVGGMWAKMLGRNWYHYKPGEHLIYYSPRSIKKALEVSGFKNIEVKRTYHILSLEYIFNRLKFYSPLIFGTILGIVRATGLKDLPLKSYTGELEAWGVKMKK